MNYKAKLKTLVVSATRLRQTAIVDDDFERVAHEFDSLVAACRRDLESKPGREPDLEPVTDFADDTRLEVQPYDPDNDTIEISGTTYSGVFFREQGCRFADQVGQVVKITAKENGVLTLTRLHYLDDQREQFIARLDDAVDMDLITAEQRDALADDIADVFNEPPPPPPIDNYKIFADIDDELARARARFPGNRFQLDALFEEAGELARALLRFQCEGLGTQAEIYNEAIQAAAMAIRVATEGDAHYSAYSPHFARASYLARMFERKATEATQAAGVALELVVDQVDAGAEASSSSADQLVDDEGAGND